MSQRYLNMDDLTVGILVGILSNHEKRSVALARMRHTTDAERTLLLQEAAVCQQAYLQLEGFVPGPDGGIDWSKEEPVPGPFTPEPPDDWNLQGKLPQELMDDLNATVKEQ